MSSTSMEKEPLIFKLGAWGLVGLTGIFVLMGGTSGQFISLLIWTAALLIMLPPLKRWLTDKLPFLRNRPLKAFLWFVLLIAGFSFITVSPKVSALELCTQLQQNTCAGDASVIQNQPKLYISGKQSSLREGTEFIVNLKPISSTPATLTNVKVKAKVKEDKFLLELEPGKLPAGNYQVTLASDAKVTVPAVKEFTVWVGEVTNLMLCNQLQQGTCSTETTAFVENDQSLYLSGDQNQLPDGAEFLVNLNYSAEPQKQTQIKLPPVKAKVKNQQVLLELQPRELPIGTYELSLSSNEKVKVSGTKTFTVWSSSADVQARTSGQLTDSLLSPERLSMCDRSNAPLPKVEAPEEPDSDEPIDETKAEEREAKRTRLNADFCKDDSDRFSAKATAIGFRVDFDPTVDPARFKILWRAGGELLTTPKIMKLSGKSSGLTYTLASPDGFPKGDYELILALEAKNAKPMYRKFKVE